MPCIIAEPEELNGLPNDTYLAFVEVVDDLAAQSLFPLPLCLGWVVEEFPKWPFLPLQQLTVEKQSECGLCGGTGHIEIQGLLLGVPEGAWCQGTSPSTMLGQGMCSPGQGNWIPKVT